MADMNVMTLIIKKGPKKLRGPAGAAAKKRLHKVPVKQLKIFENIMNRFKPFISFSDNEMYENIVTFISTLSPLSDRRLIKMFNILKSGIPWPLVKPFFKEFDEISSPQSYPNIILFFENYIKRPEIEEQINEMKEVIRSRQIDPLPSQKPDRPKDTREETNQRRVVAWELPPAIRKPMFGPGDIPSKCEQEYRRAPWMYKFINEPIRGFALKNESPQYTTDQIVNHQDGPWYRANQKWYKEVCEKGRVFNEGNVAYITATGDVIVESREMYETSKKDWEHIIDIEFSPVNEQSFDVAKTLLKENPILSNYKSEDIDAILASISGSVQSVNYDMAKKLSWILVFLSKLTKESQIYHYRVQNHQYKPEDLILLDRYTLLPEIYKNAKANSDEIEYLLKARRRFIENQFYSRLQPNEIGKRKRTSPVRPEIFRYLTTDAFSKCPQNLKDIIYYEEDGELYCFNRRELKTINPITGKKLSLEFLDELARIRSENSSNNVSEEILPEIKIKERQPEKELAPGLFQKLKEIIAFSNDNDIILQCSFCKTELINPKYKSIKGKTMVQFCEQECFDQFQF